MPATALKVVFNSRPVFALDNGGEESKMYGDCSQDSFLRFEGTVDHTIDMIYTWDSDRLSKINKQELINWNAQADELVRSGVDV